MIVRTDDVAAIPLSGPRPPGENANAGSSSKNAGILGFPRACDGVKWWSVAVLLSGLSVVLDPLVRIPAPVAAPRTRGYSIILGSMTVESDDPQRFFLVVSQWSQTPR